MTLVGLLSSLIQFSTFSVGTLINKKDHLSCYRFTLHPFNKKEKAMGKKGISHRKFSIEFKLSVLSDYFQSNQSEGSICKKYQLSKGTILRWEKEYVLAEKALPLSSELLRKLEQMRTLKETAKVSRSREEELEDEIMRLRKALEYSELRNEALHEVLKIGREQFGIDLLKKVGAKQ